MTKIQKWMITIFCIVALASIALSQVGPEMKITAEPNVLLITGPASSQHFQMRIPGKSVTRMRTKKKYWFTADGVGFELFSEENSKFLITDNPYRSDDNAVLKMYLAGFVHQNGKPKIDSEWVKLANGQTALFWSYDKIVASPNSSSTKEREMFLVLAGPGHLFGLFAPVSKSGSERETRRLLTLVLGTLTFSE